MSRKSKTQMDNPIRVIRLANHKTLVDLAELCNVHMQAIYLSECGVYPHVLPAIRIILVSIFECDGKQLDEDYQKFILHKRTEFYEKYNPYSLPEPTLEFHPVRLLRDSFNLTKMGFAKEICIQPSLLSRLEKGLSVSIPGQISTALREIVYPVEWIEELNYRTAEYHYARR